MSSLKIILFVMSVFTGLFAHADCYDDTETSRQYCLTHTSPNIPVSSCNQVSCNFKFCMEKTTLSESQCLGAGEVFYSCYLNPNNTPESCLGR
jgi:hypothetical protein